MMSTTAMMDDYSAQSAMCDQTEANDDVLVSSPISQTVMFVSHTDVPPPGVLMSAMLPGLPALETVSHYCASYPGYSGLTLCHVTSLALPQLIDVAGTLYPCYYLQLCIDTILMQTMQVVTVCQEPLFIYANYYNVQEEDSCYHTVTYLMFLFDEQFWGPLKRATRHVHGSMKDGNDLFEFEANKI